MAFIDDIKSGRTTRVACVRVRMGDRHIRIASGRRSVLGESQPENRILGQGFLAPALLPTARITQSASSLSHHSAWVIIVLSPLARQTGTAMRGRRAWLAR